MLRIFVWQLVGRRTDQFHGPLDDRVWIVPLSDVVEVLAQFLVAHVFRHVDRVLLNDHPCHVVHVAAQVDQAQPTPCKQQLVVTGSIAHSAKQRYFSYSEGEFEVFLPHMGDMLQPMEMKLNTIGATIML